MASKMRYRVRTLPSGKRIKQTISPSGRILKVTPIRRRRSRR